MLKGSRDRQEGQYYLKVNYESKSFNGTTAKEPHTSDAGRQGSCLTHLVHIKERGCWVAAPKITLQRLN